MLINIELSAGSLGGPRSLVEVAEAVEDAGFHGAGFSDHPAPSRKWLAAGGHATYDPFAALCFLAAVTTRLRLMTYLAVLPYRNPLLTLKLVTTVDRLSAGRFTLVVGSGYLRSEFLALGRPFGDRGALTDEALETLVTAGQSETLVFTGHDFHAIGQACEPRSVQRPLPPIWIGGSSGKSLERVVRYGQGWAPIVSGEAAAATTRTTPLRSAKDCGEAIGRLRDLLVEHDRNPDSVSIQLDGLLDMRAACANPEPFAELLEDLAAVGATHCMTRVPPDAGHSEALDLIAGIGELFLTT
jgi:probable F420-dependent oxidoreductase